MLNYSMLFDAWAGLLLAVGAFLLVWAAWGLVVNSSCMITSRLQDFVVEAGLVIGVVWALCTLITAFAVAFYKVYLAFAPVL